MAYILLLNPQIHSGEDVTGATRPRAGLNTATALAAAVSTLLMGLIGRVPLVLAAGLSVSGVLAAQAVPRVVQIPNPGRPHRRPGAPVNLGSSTS
jgi:AGZA family xanthine/uracil permease-like MFS transporter